jgi:hypothetical protein
MMNLMEIMQQAQGGQGMDNIARQFGLSTEQTQDAVQSLLPAMQMGLQRQTQDGDMFSGFLQSLASGQHAMTYDSDGDGIPDSAAPMGKDVLNQLFGGSHVSNAVAAQAAATSGISGAIMKAMLPVIASMVMGGLFKGMNNQGFGDVLGQLAGQAFGGGQQQANNPMGQNPMGDNPLGQILGGMLGGGQQGQNPMGGAMGGGMGGTGGLGGLLGGLLGGGAAAGAGGQGGMGGMLGQVLGGMMGGQQGQQQQQASADPMQAGLEALTNMFNAGTQVQQSHQEGLQSIFEQMMGGKR